jgi:hypothetical protein
VIRSSEDRKTLHGAAKTNSSREVLMTRPAASIVAASSVLLCLGLVACGGNSTLTGTVMPTQLQSITVAPQNAMAQNFTNKQVQFTATENFNVPSMGMSTPVLWSIGNPFSMDPTQPTPAGVSVNANGMATCTTFSGTVMIEATAPQDPNMPLSQMTAMTKNVSGMAQLTCP